MLTVALVAAGKQKRLINSCRREGPKWEETALTVPKALVPLGTDENPVRPIDYLFSHLNKLDTDVKYILVGSSSLPEYRKAWEKFALKSGISNVGFSPGNGWVNDFRLGLEHYNGEAIDGPVLVVACDRIFYPESDVAGFVKSYSRHNGPVIMVQDLGSPEALIERNCLSVDSEGRVVSFREKPSEEFLENSPSGLCALPAYMLGDPEIGAVRNYPTGLNPDCPGHLIQMLVEKSISGNARPVYSFQVPKGSIGDVGKVEFYKAAIARELGKH